MWSWSQSPGLRKYRFSSGTLPVHVTRIPFTAPPLRHRPQEAKVCIFRQTPTSLQFFIWSVCHANYKSKLLATLCQLQEVFRRSIPSPPDCLPLFGTFPTLFRDFLSGHAVSELKSIKLMHNGTLD